MSSRRLTRNLIGLSSIVLFLSAWEGAVQFGLWDATFLPAPSRILSTTLDLCLSGALLRHIAATLQRVAVGFAIAVALGLILAILCQIFKPLEYAVSPLVELVRSVAPLALLPAFMLIFGIGFVSKVAIVVWVTWVPIFLNTFQGMKSVDPRLIKVARSVGSTPGQIALKVILPSAVPFILAGLRLGMGSAFLVLVAAEMLGSNTGLGFFILEASQTFKIVDMYAAILVIGIIGFAINWCFLVAARRFTPWRDFFE